MFTSAGSNALWKFIFIIVIAEGLNVLTEWLFDFEVAKYVFCFFLLTYLVNYEKLKEDMETIRNILGHGFINEE